MVRETGRDFLSSQCHSSSHSLQPISSASMRPIRWYYLIFLTSLIPSSVPLYPCLLSYFPVSLLSCLFALSSMPLFSFISFSVLHLFLFLFYLSSGLRHIKSLYTMVDWYSHQVTRMLWSDWEDLQLREVRAVRSKISLISIGNASTSIGYSWKVVSMFEHFLVVLNYYVSPFLFFRLEYKSSSFHFSHFTFFYFSFFLFFYFLLAPPSPEFKLADQGDDFDENDYDDADVRYYSSLCNL